MVVAEAALGLLLAVMRLLLRLSCLEGLAAFLAGRALGAERGYRVDLLVYRILQFVNCPGPGIGNDVLLQDLVGLHGQPLVVSCLGVGQHLSLIHI